MLDNIILNEEKQYATNQAKIKAKSCSERVEAHTEDGLADVMVGNYGQFIVFPLIIIFLRMVRPSRCCSGFCLWSKIAFIA